MLLGDDTGVAVEVVVVDVKHEDQLDLVERGSDAALARDAGGPLEHEHVHDAGDGRPRAASASTSCSMLHGPTTWKDAK